MNILTHNLNFDINNITLQYFEDGVFLVYDYTDNFVGIVELSWDEDGGNFDHMLTYYFYNEYHLGFEFI